MEITVANTREFRSALHPCTKVGNYSVAEVSSSSTGKTGTGALQCGAQWDFLNWGSPESWQEPVAHITVPDGTWASKWCGVAICAEEPAGGVMKPCQLSQGAVVSTQQKAMDSLRSVPTMADTAIQTELWWEHAAAQESDCGLCLALTPVWSSEHAWGGVPR